MVGELAAEFEKLPNYQAATDAEKKMMWELFIGGDNGFAASARAMGQLANPNEAMKRQMKRGSGMGRFTREFLGYDKTVDEAFKEK
jgi:hypothetical protein